MTFVSVRSSRSSVILCSDETQNPPVACGTRPRRFAYLIAFLLIAVYCARAQTIAPFPAGMEVSVSSLPQPLWGCEKHALPPGKMHVVVSTVNADPEQLLPWIWHLGLTNAAIYVYYRVRDPTIPAMYDAVRLPCNMSLVVRRLLPNKGREAAVFLHHIVEHYSRLPMALMLAHDHGPASRHSLCGPFYRRARAYYRGLAFRKSLSRAGAREEAGALEAVAEHGRGLRGRGRVDVGGGGNSGTGGGLGAGGAGRGILEQDDSPRALFVKFASMVVTLSSGCIETWARGCCSVFVCSSTPSACPFPDANCTRLMRSRTEPGGVRRVFLHTNGRYDSRFENQVVDPVDGSYKPFALLRYTSAEHRTTEMWNISHEYPAGVERASKERTLELLKELLDRYNLSSRRRSSFKSCCASLILRPEHVRRWPVELYKDLLQYAMDPSLDYEATKAVSGPGWTLWLDRDYTPHDLMHYMRIDSQLKTIQGCPAQSSQHLRGLLEGMMRRGGQTRAARAAARAGAAADGHN